MEAPKLHTQESVAESSPRPLTESDRRMVKDKVGMSMALLLTSLNLVDSTTLGQVYIEPHLHAAFKSVEGKKRSVTEAKDCLQKAPNGKIVVDIQRELPSSIARMDLPTGITLNYKDYVVRCTYVSPRDTVDHQPNIPAEPVPQISQIKKTTEPRKVAQAPKQEKKSPQIVKKPQSDDTWKKDLFKN